MRARIGIALVLMITSAARADEKSDMPDGVMVEIRALFAKRDYETARTKVLDAIAKYSDPSLLFTLGQAEFNLSHWQAAIDAFEKFVTTDPPQEQVSLAQQGIGAARIEMQRERERPAPPPPPKPRRREWFTSDTIVVASGGAAVAIGTGLFFYGRKLGNDHGGTLADYDSRTDRARLLQWSGSGLITAGVIAAGVAIVRWRLRPDDGEVVITPTGATVSFAW